MGESALVEQAAQREEIESSTPKFRTIAVGVFLDAGLAVFTFIGLRLFGCSDYVSLLAASCVALLRVIYVAIRTRELDGFALFILANFAVGLGLTFLTGSPRFLLLKDSFGTAVTGLVCLGTLFAGKPFMYFASKRFSAGPDEIVEWEELWRESAGFRHIFQFTTMVWGIVFLIEAAIRIPLVYWLPFDVMAVLSSVLTPVVIAILLVWTLRYSAQQERRLRAAAEQDDAAAGNGEAISAE